ncbi:tape measure protein [Chakrabartyella piscis]|uniref:tape measure protein n=1 Tax=Chakrabartyella piscis TaxID=2918914 RepID=UPI002958D947|nr:tape measure protein [Chakrabartyella piscis]
MASIYTQMNFVDRMSAPLHNIINVVDQMANALNDVDGAINRGFDTSQIDEARRSLDLVNAQMDEIENSTRQNQSSMDGFTNKILGAAAAYASLHTASQVLDLSDQMMQTEARLNLIVDDGGSVEALQQDIFDVAQNTRASYQSTADMIAKLGMQAGDAFSSNDELLYFAEQLNKQMVVAGTSTQGVDSVMLQLTQSMAAGVLQGEELNALLDNASPIVANIQRYLEEVQNIDVSNIKDLASQGVITADVIKNAMFYAAEDTNATFAAMPITFAQAWTGIQNDLLMTFQPLLQTIAQGAGWIHDNWSTLEPIFFGLAGAVTAYAVALGIQTAATWIANGAAQAFFTTLLANPLTWIALIVGVLIGVLYQWVQSVGGVEVAWKIAMNGILTAWDWVQIGLMTGVYWVMNKFNEFQLMFATVSTNIQNFMGDMKAGTLMILQNMVNGAIGIINDFIGIINKIPGVSIDAIAQVSFGTTAELENQAAKATRNTELANYSNEIASQIAARDDSLYQMQTNAYNATAERQAEIDAMQANIAAKNAVAENETFAAMNANLDTIAGNTGDIADSVAVTGEDMKYLRDLAEQDTVNRYTTAEIQVHMTNNNSVTSTMDLDGMVDYLAEGVNEAMAKSAEGVHE